MIAEGEYNFRRGAGRWWIPAVALRLSAVSGAVCFTNFVLSILPSGKREPVGTTEELLPQVCGEMDLCGDRGDDGRPRGVFCSALHLRGAWWGVRSAGGLQLQGLQGPRQHLSPGCCRWDLPASEESQQGYQGLPFCPAQPPGGAAFALSSLTCWDLLSAVLSVGLFCHRCQTQTLFLLPPASWLLHPHRRYPYLISWASNLSRDSILSPRGSKLIQPLFGITEMRQLPGTSPTGCLCCVQEGVTCFYISPYKNPTYR